jgi:hypothetical protein
MGSSVHLPAKGARELRKSARCDADLPARKFDFMNGLRAESARLTDRIDPPVLRITETRGARFQRNPCARK